MIPEGDCAWDVRAGDRDPGTWELERLEGSSARVLTSWLQEAHPALQTCGLGGCEPHSLRVFAGSAIMPYRGRLGQ